MFRENVEEDDRLPFCPSSQRQKVQTMFSDEASSPPPNPFYPS
jgi:hypothetical protein